MVFFHLWVLPHHRHFGILSKEQIKIIGGSSGRLETWGNRSWQPCAICAMATQCIEGGQPGPPSPTAPSNPMSASRSTGCGPPGRPPFEGSHPQSSIFTKKGSRRKFSVEFVWCTEVNAQTPPAFEVDSLAKMHHSIEPEPNTFMGRSFQPTAA